MPEAVPQMSGSSLPRARLRPLSQPPLDAITVYNTATHCYVLGTDSLQRDYHLMTCRKHSIEQAVTFASFGSASGGSNNNTASESDAEERGGVSPATSSFRNPSHQQQQQQQTPFCSLEDLHDYTNYAVYSPTEAASLVEALQREHGDSMQVLPAVALLGAVRFTEGYYLVVITARRAVGYIGAHRLFEAAQVELVSLLLDNDWVVAQMQSQLLQQQQQQQQQQSRRGGELDGLSSFPGGSGHGTTAGAAAGVFHRRKPASFKKSTSSATAAAAAYLFQRRPLEELYRQQFLSSLSRTSSFFYSHSYDLTNTLQRNMLADGAAARHEDADQRGPNTGHFASPRAGARDAAVASAEGLGAPRMAYVWNEYLLEPWQLPDVAERSRSGSSTSDVTRDDNTANGDQTPERTQDAAEDARTPAIPQYPAAFTRWRTFLIHGYIVQRTVVVRRPALHTLLLTLIARVSKASAGVRYLRRGINSDGHVANHVEVEQIVSDESAWNGLFTDGALSSYVQLRGSVPLRWYHPPASSRLLPKPPIVIGPQDAEWSATCLHFQDLLREYGAPILAHDLLKKKEHHTRETALGDAYRVAVQALSAAIARASEDADRHSNNAAQVSGAGYTTAAALLSAPLRSSNVLQYESTDLRDLGPLAWNTMTAFAEHHFDQVGCFVCRRQRATDGIAEAAAAAASVSSATRDYAITDEDCPCVATRIQSGVVRSNCLDCIDRTNLGQLFHGLQALGEQLVGLQLLHHAADLRDSPAVTELLLEMYLAVGDALATQYGGSAQVGAGVLHRGAGWDQLMGVKRLYNNVMGDRDKQEAIKLLLGRTQPQPRRRSRARNGALHTPGQVLLPAALTSSLSGTNSLSSSITATSPGVAEAVAAAVTGQSSPSNGSFTPNSGALVVRQAPPASSSSSFFTGLLQTASRWWGETTGASTASATATAAMAAAAALRAAQHAAAEAEAEPDYYENSASAPRLPPAGLLAAWWVQPLREFAAWYRACGIDVCADGRAACAGAGAGGEENGTSKALDHNRSIINSSTGSVEGAASSAGSGPTAALSSFRSSSLHSRGRSATITTTTTTPQPSATVRRSPAAATVAVLGDAFAQHLLAEDTLAQQRWMLSVARWERQACLVPLQRSAAASSSSLSSTTTTSGGGQRQASAAAAATSTSTGFYARDGGGAGGGGVGGSGNVGRLFNSGTAAAAATGSILRPSASTWNIDDTVAANLPVGDLPDNDSLLGAEAVLSTSRMSRGGVEGSATELNASVAPFSLTLTPSLFTDPWIVLRTTTHVLPVSSTLLAHRQASHAIVQTPSSPLPPPRTQEEASRKSAEPTTSAPLALLRQWRSQQHSHTASTVSMRKVHHDGKLSLPFAQHRAMAVSVTWQLFGSVSPVVASALSSSWERQVWRSAEAPHNHRAFPSAVRSSVFAHQHAVLAQLASSETMWIADSVKTDKRDDARQLGKGEVDSDRGNGGGVVVSRGQQDARRPARTAHRSAKPQQPQQQQQPSLRITADCDNEDGAFVVAMLTVLCGDPHGWAGAEIVTALQRLRFPARLPALVQRVLRHSDVQPPLSGAELMTCAGPRNGRIRESDVLDYWRRRLAAVVKTVVVVAEGDTKAGSAPAAIDGASQQQAAKTLTTAASLLCRLSLLLQSVHQPSPSSPLSSSAPPVAARAERRSHAASPVARIPSGGSAGAFPFPANRLSAATSSAFLSTSLHTGIGKVRSGSPPATAAAESDVVQTRVDALTLMALTPLLQSAPGSTDVPPEVQHELMTSSDANMSPAMRRHWLLCRLLQPLFPSSVLTPRLLHGTLRNLFADASPPDFSSSSFSSLCACVQVPSTQGGGPHRTQHHVRYTFALSPQGQAPPQQHQHPQSQQQRQQQQQQQMRSQLAAGALSSVSNMYSSTNNSSSGGGAGDFYRHDDAPSARSGDPSLSSALPPSPAAAGAASLRAMHIPATLEVRCCCTALQLFHWCAQYRRRCWRAHTLERLASAAPEKLRGVKSHLSELKVPQRRASSSLSFAAASFHLCTQARSDEDDNGTWRLLWWAVENNFVVPVVRRREQTTLEMLADETALFCVLDDVPRVALNIERRSRGEVWRHADSSQQQQQRDATEATSSTVCHCGDKGSAIYGVALTAAALPVHRLTRRSARTDMVVLSETIASLGLSAATRIQEFFRDHAVHGWTRTGLKVGGGHAGSSAGGGGGGDGGATVALFGGGGASAAVAASTPTTASARAGVSASPSGTTGMGGGSSGSSVAGGSASSPAAAAEASCIVTPAEVIHAFYLLAEECLQSIQSVMVALQFMSLEAFADEHALHAYISFFVNTYNAAYVVAWLTNVKELISAAAMAAEKMRGSSSGAARGEHHGGAPSTSAAAAAAATRTIDLLSLPTLCNTNVACFLHVYGVAIGSVFLSLAEIKYGVLGGNRAPPYRDAPLWSSSLLQGQPKKDQATVKSGLSCLPDRITEQNDAWQWPDLVPLHLRAEMPEEARLASLRQHPHVQAAVELRELCDAYGAAPSTEDKTHRAPSPTSLQASKSSATLAARASSVASADTLYTSPTSREPHFSTSRSPTTRAAATTMSTPPSSAAAVPLSPKRAAGTAAHVSSSGSTTTTTTTTTMAPPPYPRTTQTERRRLRYAELVDRWSSDVVRHLTFRVSLQLIDLYLPPPLLHLCHSLDGGEGGGGAAAGLDGPSALSSSSGGGGGNNAHGAARSASLDSHLRLDVDGERVPWYLQPLLNTMPLVHPTLQSSRLGVVYGVAGEDDGRARGTLVPQLNPEANGMLLQPLRMWSSPSYYVVGGDGVNGEEAVARAFQLLQALSGSYLGADGYNVVSHTAGTHTSSGGSAPMPQQHLCAPLHSDGLLAQLHSTEAAFRSALRSTDPQLFTAAPASFAMPAMHGHFGVAVPTACSAPLHNAMKPLMFEWCRATESGVDSISLLAKPGSQLRVLLKVLALLEDSYVSGEAVRQLQASMETQ